MTDSSFSWVTIRVDFIGTLYTTALMIYLTYITRMSASNAGFSLNMAGTSSTAALPDGSTN